MRLSSVDLPAPSGPMTQTVRPRSTDRLTSRTATNPPSDLETFDPQQPGHPPPSSVARQIR